MTLTIYSPDYDEDDGYGKGLSGHIYLDPSKYDKTDGIGPFKKFQDALKYCLEKRIRLDSIEYMYRENDEQLFVKCPLA